MRRTAVLTLFAALALFAIALPASARERPNDPVIPTMPICDPGDDCSSNPPPPPPPCCDPMPVSHDPIDLVFEGGIEEGGYRELSRSGCRTVVNYIAGKKLLFGLQTLFQHNLKTRWCWSYNTVTYIDATCYISDRTSTEVRLDGPCEVSNFTFMFNNNPNGGMAVTAVGYYQKCFVDDVCYDPFSLTVTTLLRSNGTYTRLQ